MFLEISKVLVRTPVHSLLDNQSTLAEKPSALFCEGLYLSSREFWSELQKTDWANVLTNRRIFDTVLKYYIRSCTRSTPFATFAGCALADVSDSTELILSSPDKHRKHCRLDMNFLTTIIKWLENIPSIRGQLRFYPNDSIYATDTEYRYASYEIKNHGRSYSLGTIKKTSLVETVLAESVNGVTIEYLESLLTTITARSISETRSFVEETLASQLLFSELEPSITGTDPLQELISKLECKHSSKHIVNQLRMVQEIIEDQSIGLDSYQLIETILDRLKIVETLPKNIFQTDLILQTEKFELDKKVLGHIAHQIDMLTVFAKRIISSDLENFKKKLILKYDQHPVPLAMALDSDIGIGYSSNSDENFFDTDLIRDIVFEQTHTDNFFQFDEIQKFILSKYHEFILNNKKSIEITEDELSDLKSNVKNFTYPSSLYVFGSLFDDKEIEQNNFMFYLKGIGGPSSADLLTRFCNCDKQINYFVQELIKEEESGNSDVVFAEIVHLPESRIGNILLRPVLRDHEVVYCGKSGALLNQQISVNDLSVFVERDELILFSKKLNKRVIPRLTNAHNFRFKSLPIYKFLCDLQYQGNYNPVVWDWGVLSTSKYLPRVYFKNIIIKRAQWVIDISDIKDLPSDRVAYVPFFSNLIRLKNIPSKVVYMEGDNELYIDFNDCEILDILVKYINKYKHIILEEFIFCEENCLVKSEDGKPYTNEIIIPLTPTKRKMTYGVPMIDVNKYSILENKYYPGSEWLYIKLYCGISVAEKLLIEMLLPFVEQFKGSLFEKFFFVRYKDDFHHIRVRFYNSDCYRNFILEEKFLHLCQQFEAKDYISKITIDTYNKELERYSVEFIDDSETIFCNDSNATLKLLKYLNGYDDRIRFLTIIRSIDMLLDDFHLSVAEKKELMGVLQNNFFEEFGASLYLQRQLNSKYRDFQKDIFSFLNPKNDIANGIFDFVFALKQRSKQNRDTIESLSCKISGNKNRILELLKSYLHMSVNRFFNAQQRKHELVIYHFLDKFYSSKKILSNIESSALNHKS